MSRWIVMVLMLLTTGLLSWADAPPKSPPPPPPGHGRHWPEDARRYWRNRWRREPIDENKWNEAQEFMRLHSPRRLAFVLSLPEGPFRDGIRRYILGRYRDIQNLSEQNETELHDLVVKRLELEDQAWGLSVDLAQSENPDEQSRLHNDLSDKVRQLVALGFQERQLRIARLEKAVQREKDKLAAEKERTDEVVAEQLNRWEREGQSVHRRVSTTNPTTQPLETPESSEPAETMTPEQ
ncbi:MAG: hypothetical protein IT446_10750 [Phycisphaerales bacterium]|nr:hypothetical protein [Phycisphaerales bacterium]